LRRGVSTWLSFLGFRLQASGFGAGKTAFTERWEWLMKIAMASVSEVHYLPGLAQRRGFLVVADQERLERRYGQLVRREAHRGARA
jgi:hypothetical protein